MYLLRVILKSKHNNLTKQTKMKKVIAIFAIATTLVACGGNASTEATATDSTAVDSTVVAVDSAAVVADTTAVFFYAQSDEVPDVPLVEVLLHHAVLRS